VSLLGRLPTFRWWAGVYLQRDLLIRQVLGMIAKGVFGDHGALSSFGVVVGFVDFGHERNLKNAGFRSI
jgi:hypothetical protein